MIFYDGFRAHLLADVIECLAAQRIAVLGLQVHKSDQLQSLDMSVFGPVKHYRNTVLMEFLKRFVFLTDGGAHAGRLDAWNCVRERFEKGESETTVASGFRKSVVWTLNAAIVCKHGLW